MLPRIFIGGTGRSGTTILYRALGCHQQIYALPKEMRFITETDGIMNLVDALSTRYSINHARETLYKFEQLMRVYMAKPEGPHYPNYDLPNWLGGPFYYQTLDAFCARLVEFEFMGISAPMRVESVTPKGHNSWKRHLRKLAGMQPMRGEIPQYHFPEQSVRLVKYFQDRQEILSLAAAFVDTLFMHVTRQEGKETWCEKTPTNLQYIDFIWELFPGSAFVHIKRDPRGVLRSLRKVKWAPSELPQLCLFLQKIYERWFSLQERVDLSQQRYIEVRLEDLVIQPAKTLAEITAVCDLPDAFANLPEISPEKVNSWREKMSPADVELVNHLLGDYIEKMGYEV